MGVKWNTRLYPPEIWEVGAQFNYSYVYVGFNDKDQLNGILEN